MNLHVEHQGGSGAPLLFVHGWGMHGGMWGEVLPQLAAHFQVMAVDLPGHGYSARFAQRDISPFADLRERDAGLSASAGSGKREGESAESNAHNDPLSISYLDAIVDQLAAQFTESLSVCGWSLGGQIALRWAMRYPEQVSRLVLVSATPCFVQRDDWPCAMAADTLSSFSDALQQNYALTLRRFLALQVRGSENEREQLATLRSTLASRGEPDLAALQVGLEILRDVDLRAALQQVRQPTLVIAGSRDTLTPLSASQHMALRLHAARLAAIEGAAHAPFLSHPEGFVKNVMDFMHE